MMASFLLLLAVVSVCFLTSRGEIIVINSTQCGTDGLTTWVTWSTWSGLGACSELCQGDTGESSRRRSRTCPEQVDSCTADQVEEQFFACTGTDPPVDGGYGQWSKWKRGRCSVFCGGKGLRLLKRTRKCDTPPPSCGGRDCVGKDTQIRYRLCRTRSCRGICHPRQYFTVLLSPRIPGHYLRCLRGRVDVVPCPKKINGSFRKNNLWRIRLLCGL